MSNYRPKRIIATFFDPFDDSELSSLNFSYSPRLAATGFYSHRIRRLLEFHRAVDAKILEGRKPRVMLKFFR